MLWDQWTSTSMWVLVLAMWTVASGRFSLTTYSSQNSSAISLCRLWNDLPHLENKHARNARSHVGTAMDRVAMVLTASECPLQDSMERSWESFEGLGTEWLQSNLVCSDRARAYAGWLAWLPSLERSNMTHVQSLFRHFHLGTGRFFKHRTHRAMPRQSYSPDQSNFRPQKPFPTAPGPATDTNFPAPVPPTSSSFTSYAPWQSRLIYWVCNRHLLYSSYIHATTLLSSSTSLKNIVKLF